MEVLLNVHLYELRFVVITLFFVTNAFKIFNIDMILIFTLFYDLL